MRKMWVLMLCFLIMALCGCELMKGNSSSEISTEIPSETATSESDGINKDLVQEEFPFDDVTEVSCQEYDENNILGLKAIYVSDLVLIYCFSQKEIWKDYGNDNDGIAVYGLDELDCRIATPKYSFKESDHFIWVRIERDKDKRIVGFSISIDQSYLHYSIYGLLDLQLTIQDAKHNESQTQMFRDNQWGEIVNYKLDLSIQLTRQLPKGGAVVEAVNRATDLKLQKHTKGGLL